MAQLLGPTPPLLRLVTGAGDWWTRAQDGRYELARVTGDGFVYNLDGTKTANPIAAHAWDWDSSTWPPPADQNFVGRWWLILYAPVNVPYATTNDGTFNSPGICGDFWNDPTTQSPDPGPWAGTIGTNSPAALVERVFSLIGQRHVPGFECSHVIVAFDQTQFAPDGSSVLPGGALGTAYPDGNWGHHGKPSSGEWIVARNSTAEYWRYPREGDHLT
jgi:hypothetical protein